MFSSKQHFHSLFPLDSIPSSANVCQCACVLGQVRFFAIPWTGVWCLTGSSVHGFSRKEYWSGLDSSGKMVYFGAAFETLFLSFSLFFFFFYWETVKRELFFIAPTFLINILLKACFTSLFLRLQINGFSMGFTKMQITDTIFPCSTDWLFAGLRYMQVRDPLDSSWRNTNSETMTW